MGLFGALGKAVGGVGKMVGGVAGVAGSAGKAASGMAGLAAKPMSGVTPPTGGIAGGILRKVQPPMGKKLSRPMGMSRSFGGKR